MTILTLPPCPVCKQSSTGVYGNRLGCARCGTLGAKRPPALLRRGTPEVELTTGEVTP